MYNLENLAYAYGEPSSTGTIKTFPEDFKVDEILGFELTGEGEHLFLRLEKKGLNTEELLRSLARKLGKSEKMISYAGLKDRHALATQWLCVHCPGETLENPELLAGEGWRVLEAKRHIKKLKTGALAANKFSLILREISQPSEVDQRLLQIQSSGVPNYFGSQRFGHGGQNLSKAEALLLAGVKVKNRFLRGIYYSAARSFLFNLILDARVSADNWSKALSGDLMLLAGTNSFFSIEDPDTIIQQRLTDNDISPAAPLWGRGQERTSLAALDLQNKALANYQAWCAALEQHGLERAYRPLRLQVAHFKWQWQDETTLILNFQLEAGSYATSVVRELIKT